MNSVHLSLALCTALLLPARALDSALASAPLPGPVCLDSEEGIIVWREDGYYQQPFMTDLREIELVDILRDPETGERSELRYADVTTFTAYTEKFAGRDRTVLAGFAPEGEFVLALMQDGEERALYRLDNRAHAMPALLYDSTTLPELSKGRVRESHESPISGTCLGPRWLPQGEPRGPHPARRQRQRRGVRWPTRGQPQGPGLVHRGP